MDDLINRQAAIDAIEKIYLPQTKGETATEEINRVAWRCALNCAEEMVRRLPPAQKEQTAEWVPSTKYKGFLTCSSCEDCYIEGWNNKERKWRYCPQCGKRMKREGV